MSEPIPPLCHECGLPMERDVFGETMFPDMVFWVCYCTWVGDSDE